MAKFDVFVGRKEELALIDEWVSRWNTMHVIAVQGDGGVGKTWLLLETLRRYGCRDDCAVVYFDAAEHTFSVQYEMMYLVEQLGVEHFPRFLAGIDELTRTYYDLPVLEAQAREREILKIGIEEINAQLQNRRLIYLSDTLEVLEYAIGTDSGLIGLEEHEYAVQFTNALFISAGRNMERLLPALRRDFGPEHVTYITLKNFDRMENAEFFAALDREDFIPPDMEHKLHFLTAGRPVLLSLALEWLARDIPLPELAERSLAELESLPPDELRGLRERFEFELVGRVRELRRPLDRAVLYMAHINRRTDARILSTLLEIGSAEADELLHLLTGLSFVKYNPITHSCMLHDEMKNLVNRHAWPYVDPTGEIRRRLAAKVIAEYYTPRIRELAGQTKAQLESDRGPVRRAVIGSAEWEQWRLEAESLYYRLQVDAQDGFRYFEDRFTEAQRNNHLIRMQFLLNEVETSGHTGIRDTLELRKAQSLHLRGAGGQAAKICRVLLRRRDLSPENRITAHNILGVIAAPTDPEGARRHYEAALHLAEEHGVTSMIGVLHNNLGQLCRSIGRLDQAIAHYQQAIEHSTRAGNPLLVAAATNNLAYAYRLRGDLIQADVLCRVALAQRKRLGLERDLAYSYLTKGEIDRDRGDLESAERYTKLALRSFDKVNETRGQIMAYNSLANIRRHMYRYEEAIIYLERGIELAEQIRDEPLLANLLNVYGRGQRDRAVLLQQTEAKESAELIRALFRSAEEYLERSLNLATHYGDQWLIARSRFELTLAYFLSQSRSETSLNEMLNQIWETAALLDDALLMGYVEEMRGEIAERRRDYTTAARHFGQAALLLARRSGREPDRFFDRLSDRLLNPDLPAEAAQALAHGILDVISHAAKTDALQSLQMLCWRVLGAAM